MVVAAPNEQRAVFKPGGARGSRRMPDYDVVALYGDDGAIAKRGAWRQLIELVQQPGASARGEGEALGFGNARRQDEFGAAD